MCRHVVFLVSAFVLAGWLAEAGAGEPQFQIRLRSGNTVAADKAWIQGDRLFRHSRKTT